MSSGVTHLSSLREKKTAVTVAVHVILHPTTTEKVSHVPCFIDSSLLVVQELIKADTMLKTLLLNQYLLLFLLLLATRTPTVRSFTPLKGVSVTSVATGEPVDLEDFVSKNSGEDGRRSMIIFGTYAADFNAIEYAQRLRYYWPQLQQTCGISKCAFLLNCNPEAAKAMTSEVDLATDASGKGDIVLLVDPKGQAGRTFGVERGWLPDNEDVSPFLKLFGMLWGLGAWATLPAVIGKSNKPCHLV